MIWSIFIPIEEEELCFGMFETDEIVEYVGILLGSL